MTRRYLLFLLILAGSNATWALKISASAQGFEGEFARLYVVSDFITGKEEKLDVVKIGSDGHFELNGYMQKPSLIKIRIDNKSVDLLSLPGFYLKINLKYDATENSDRIFDKSLEVDVLEESDLNINSQVFKYQKDYADFLERNHSKLVTKNILPDVYTFQDEMRAKYQKGPAFFQTYLEYDLAGLEDAVLGSEKKLFQYYIYRRPVRYENPAYMNFFRQFYQERFIQISQGKDGFQMLSAVNGSQDYDKLFDIVSRHPYAENDTVTQLFIILGLKEVYGDETFKKVKVLSMLEMVRDRALNPENRKIAANILSELRFLSPGSPAPDFSLEDVEAGIMHLSDFADRYVLLMFWSAYSTISLRDFSLLKDYSEKYGEKLLIVAVNMDDDRVKALTFIERNEFPFVFLFKDNQYDLVDKYRVYASPFYVLIDNKGLIAKYPASNPEEKLEREMVEMLSEN